MKQLVLMRHGHAAPFDTEAADFARPLERRGVADVASVAMRLAQMPWRPDCIVTSPARRTLETARTMASAFGFDPEQIQAEPRLYNADLSDWRSVILALPQEANKPLVVGHNPGISQFAQWLLPAQRVAGLTPGTSLLLDCRIANWADLTPTAVHRANREAPQDPVNTRGR